MLNVVSFFSGCGGLDLGFEQAGFNVLWANDVDNAVSKTYKYNHPNSTFSLCDLRAVSPDDIPECDGFIGGPPCQSWSIAGLRKGLDDERGKLFLTYISLIQLKQPMFFLIENVQGLLDDRFKIAFENFLIALTNAGYNINWQLLDAVNFGVPQNRKRVFIVGFKKNLNKEFSFPLPDVNGTSNISDAIADIHIPPKLYRNDELVHPNLELSNHDLIDIPYSDYYANGNRRRPWTLPSFTIHATAANIPLHPSSPQMIFNGPQNWQFQTDKLKAYRRFSIRECARLQTFPDSYRFFYNNISSGYKMVGNAVPPLLAKVLATSIKNVLEETDLDCYSKTIEDTIDMNACVLVGYCKDSKQQVKTIENSLYYIRSDKRIGSISLSNCLVPKYLLLHHGCNILLLQLSSDKPFLTTASFLQNLGFEVSGQYYLCFRIKNKNLLCIDRLINKKRLSLNRYIKKYFPFFTTLGEVFK